MKRIMINIPDNIHPFLKNSYFNLFCHILGATIYLYGCGNPSPEHVNNQVRLVKTGEKVFKLDSLTSPNLSYLAYNEGNDSFVMLANKRNTLLYFDYESGEVVDFIKFETEGPNGIGGYPNKHFNLISEDSLLVTNPITSTFYLINKNGKILNKKAIYTNPQNKEEISPGISPSNSSPVYFLNKHFYFPMYIGGRHFEDHTKMYTMAVGDFASEKLQKLMFRPSSYNDGFWGGNGEMDRAYHTLNTNTNSFVFSFPIDDQLFIMDLSGKVTTKMAKSKELGKIRPFSSGYKEGIDFNEYIIYDYTTSRYNQIIYDQFRDIYYRFVMIGNQPSEIENPEIGYNLNASVMILDNAFNLIGETRIDRGRHWFHNFFVSKAGMHILVKPEHYLNEDDLVFDIFLPQ